MSTDDLGCTASASTLISSGAHSSAFWYSKRSALALTLFLFIVAQIVSFLVPPFQSPDEPAHLKRAYALSRGEIFLGKEDGATGADIDTGLLQYMNIFDAIRFQYGTKYTASIDSSSADISWSGTRRFSGFPNTAFYFPLAYLPQAVAMAVGERSGLAIRETYYLARLLSLIGTMALIWAALTVYPAPPIVIAILFMPMVLFQFASASLDSLSFAAATLAGALFMRGADTRFSFQPPLFIALLLCLLLLATSRIAPIALTPVTLVLAHIRKSRLYLVLSVTLIALSLAWIAFGLATVQGVHVHEASTAEVVQYYLSRPLSFVRVFVNTVTDANTLEGYWRMFIGVLGWQDTPLGSELYVSAAVLLAALATLGVLAHRHQPSAAFSLSSVCLACGALAAVLLMYFAFLVTYNPHPAKVIGGILGRYFVPMFIVLVYAMFSKRQPGVELRLEVTVLSSMVILFIAGTIPRLLHRYWMG